MKQNNHNTHFYSIQEVERCLKSTKEFEDGEQLFYFIGALRYVYDENKKKDKEIDRLNNIINMAIVAINTYQDSKTLSIEYKDLKRIRGILKGNDFDIQMFEEYLKELKESGNNEKI